MGINLQEDMNNVFLDCGFEEDIIYTPSGGVAKTIKAQVYRQGSISTSSGNRTGTATSNTRNRMYDVSIDISTDATEGISNITVNEDKVACKAKIGDASDSIFTVGGILLDDAGAFRLGLKP